MAMTKPPTRPQPTMTDRTVAEKQARAERVAAALRANLQKRKQLARARTPAVGPKKGGGSSDPPA